MDSTIGQRDGELIPFWTLPVVAIIWVSAWPPDSPRGTTTSPTQQANEKADEPYAWVERQTVDEIRDLATAFRIPNAPVANGANVAGLDHFVARGSFVTNPRDGFDHPGHPYRTTPAILRVPSVALGA